MIAAYHGPSTRSRAISLHYAGTYIGTVLGGTLGGWIAMHYGWRSVFGIFGIVGGAYAITLLFALRDRRPAETDVTASRFSLSQLGTDILRAPGYKRLFIVFAVASICDWSIYTWMPMYLYETFHFNLAQAGFTSTFYIKAGGFLGLLAGGVLADMWARRSGRAHVGTQAIGLLLAAPFLVLAGFTHVTVVLFMAMALFGLGKGMYDGNTMPVLCDRIVPEKRATAFGFINFGGTFCGGIVAAGAGALKNSLGLGAIFCLCGGLLLLSGFLMITVPQGHIEESPQT